MAPADRREIAERPATRSEAEARPTDVAPFLERNLHDRSGVERSRSTKETHQQFNVEDPPRPERLRERLDERGSDSKHLEAALRVIDPEIEDHRRDRGEDTTLEVAGTGALDVSTQNGDARPECHIDRGCRAHEIDDAAQFARR